MTKPVAYSVSVACVGILVFLFLLPGKRKESINGMFAFNNTSKKHTVAVFAEGCFWHSEMVFENLVGVDSVVSGYSGGTEENPFYERVCSGCTGHAEAVMVYYDTTRISYPELVKAFFDSHNPTTVNAQGMDIGSQYRSIAFYKNKHEKEVIEGFISNLNKSKHSHHKVVTEVMPLTKFYRAENYHQDFASKNPEDTYVKFICVPAFLEFRMHHNGSFKTKCFKQKHLN